MQSNHHHRESAVSFHKSGGHSHDGVNSSRIDFSSYSDADLAPLVAKIKKKIKSGGDSGDSEKVTLENQPVDDLIPTGAPLEVTLTSGYNDAASGWGDNTGWIKVSWTVYDAPGDITNDDDADDLLSVGYMEGDGTTPEDDTDATAPVLDEIQSVEAINEYQVSYWNIVFEPGGGYHDPTTEHRKFIRTDETEVLIAPVPLGKTFHVRVRGISGNGKHSDPATNDSTSHILVGGGGFSETPSAPTGLDAISLGPDSIMLTWDESTHPLVINGGNYRVQCDTTSGFASPDFARTVGGESTTFTGLSQGTQYWFRVKAKTSTGVLSDWSATLGPETTGTLGPGDISDGAAPTSSPAANVVGGPKYLWVKWDPITNADPVTYDIHLSTSSGFTPNSGNKVGQVDGTSFVIRYLPGTTTQLSYDTTYYVKIVARDQDGSAAAGTQGSAQCQKISGGTGGDIVADSITANDINSLTLTGTKYVQAGGASSSDPYARLYTTSGVGRLDMHPGTTYGSTDPGYIYSKSDGTDMWTEISSPAATSSSNPVVVKLLTDNSTKTKSELYINSDKLISEAREEQILFKFSQNISRSSLTLTQLDFAYTDIVGGNYWSMYSASGSENYITLPRIGQYLVSWNAYWGGASANSTASGKRGSRTLAMSKGSASAPAGSDYWLYKEVIVPFPDSTDYTWQTGAASGSIVVRATAGDDTDYLRFWTNNYMVNSAGSGESGNATCYFIIGVIRISA